ncbi:MAG TPA: lamin tail domain-containing protein, partial [Bacteroidia bacterium]|nr:lamin tail domain-containing protein [Bacteroidia bacterium]
MLINVAKSQVVINEICYTNPGLAITDGYGNASDYIELYNATPGLPVNMANYYLTNDINNLYKWKIPSTITIPSLGFQVFFCTGLNKTDPTGYIHTNFNIEQCKNQWVLLTRSPGVIVDSFFVRRTKPGDNWGRYPDYVSITNQSWKLLNGASTAITSFSTTNALYPAASAYIAYAPVPTFSTNPGFTPPASGQYDLYIADTVNFQINYTQGFCGQLGGSIPCTSLTGCVGTTSTATTYTYVNGIDVIPAVGMTNVITAITIPKGTYSLSYLPS